MIFIIPNKVWSLSLELLEYRLKYSFVFLKKYFKNEINIFKSIVSSFNFGYSSKKFCLKDITEGKQSNLVGKLVEYNSEIQILEKVWIEIIEVALYQEIKYIDRRKIFYFLGENVVKYNKKYLFLKKMN